MNINLNEHMHGCMDVCMENFMYMYACKTIEFYSDLKEFAISGAKLYL